MGTIIGKPWCARGIKQNGTKFCRHYDTKEQAKRYIYDLRCRKRGNGIVLPNAY